MCFRLTGRGYRVEGNPGSAEDVYKRQSLHISKARWRVTDMPSAASRRRFIASRSSAPSAVRQPITTPCAPARRKERISRSITDSSCLLSTSSYDLVVEGRADGVIHGDSALPEAVTIDEIKGTYRDLEKMKEPVPGHRAQANCYAYMYAAGQNRERMNVRMTYCNMETEELRYFTQEYFVRELEEWFFSLLEE